MKKIKYFSLLSMLLILLSAQWSLASFQCADVLGNFRSTFPRTAVYRIGGLATDVYFSSREIRIVQRLSQDGGAIDLTIFPVLTAILDIPRFQIESTGSVVTGVVKRDFSLLELTQRSGNLNLATTEISRLLNQGVESSALKEAGDFGSDTRIEVFQNDILPDMTPVNFRRRYEQVYASYWSHLPTVFKLVLSTEYYLGGESNFKDSLASRLLESSYGIDSDRSQEVLLTLNDLIVRDLMRGEASAAEIQGFPYSANLVPFQTLVRESDWSRRQNRRAFYQEAPDDPHTFASGVERFIDDIDVDYLGIGPNHRTINVDDLPPEIIDLSHIATLKIEFGVETLGDLAHKVTGVDLMYEVGLSRNEIRDLYFYLRDNYSVRLRLGELGYVLNIFRER